MEEKQNNQITHNNHYVPQFYLRNWSNDQDKTKIRVYDTIVSAPQVPLWRNAPIKSTASWTDFYTRELDGAELDDIESWLDRDFEAPAKPAFDKAINGERLRGEDYQALVRFLGCQCVRTPPKMIRLLNQGKIDIPVVLDEVSEDAAEIAKIGEIPTMDYPPIPYSELLPMKIEIDPDEGKLMLGVEVGQGAFYFAMKTALDKPLEKLQRQRWQIIHCAEGMLFPTSDDPVVHLRRENSEYMLGGGWNINGTEIFMPLSPKLLLYTKIGSRRRAYELDYSEKASQIFIGAIIVNAHRQIYALEEIPNIEKIRPRLPNREVYMAERAAQQSWHSHSQASENTFREKNWGKTVTVVHNLPDKK